MKLALVSYGRLCVGGGRLVGFWLLHWMGWFHRRTERTRTTNGSERVGEHGEATVATAPALHRCFAYGICADKDKGTVVTSILLVDL